MGKKLLCLMLAALLGALCGCQGKAGDGSGLTSPSSVLLPPAESVPPAPPEESAQPEADAPKAPPIEEAPLPPPLPSGQSAPELLEGEPRLVLSLREYHPQKDGVGCGCIVEIPRLEGEGMEEANAPIDELSRRWENFLTEAGGHGNGYGPSMEVRTLPYTNARWIQAVVHYMTFPNYAYWGDACSVNFDRVEGRAVTVDEMLARMELTPELLTEGLKQQELSQVLFYFSYPSPKVQRVEVQAFRGREDGSAVFYLWLEVLPMEGLDEDHRLVMYDTRTGTFAEFRGRVPDSYLEPPNLSDPPLQWEKDPGFRAYS